MYTPPNEIIKGNLGIDDRKIPQETIRPASISIIDWIVTEEKSVEEIILDILVFDNTTGGEISLTDIQIRVQIHRLTDYNNNWDLVFEHENITQLNGDRKSTNFHLNYVPIETGFFNINIFLFINDSEDSYLSLQHNWHNINIISNLIKQDFDDDFKDDSLYIDTDISYYSYEFKVELDIQQIQNDSIIDTWKLVDTNFVTNIEFPTTFYALQSGRYQIQQSIFVWPDGIPRSSDDIDNSVKLLIDYQDFGIIELNAVDEFLNVYSEVSISDHSMGDGTANCQDDFGLQYKIQYAFSQVYELEIEFQVHNLVNNNSIQTSDQIDLSEFRYAFFTGDNRQGVQQRQINIRSDRNDFPGNVRDMEFLITVTNLDKQISVSSIETMNYDINMCGGYSTLSDQSPLHRDTSSDNINNSLSELKSLSSQFIWLSLLVIKAKKHNKSQ